MLFGRIFGGKRQSAAPHVVSRSIPRPPTPTAKKTEAGSLELAQDQRSNDQVSNREGGFDPYNSGAFSKKANVWERVDRR
jgi:hypothetical protein